MRLRGHGHFHVSCAEIPGQGGWLSWRAKRCSCRRCGHKLGIHGSPTCTMSMGRGRRNRLARGRGEQGSGLHVHDDEQRPPCRRYSRPGRCRKSLSAGSRLRSGQEAGQGTGRQRRGHEPDRAPPGHQAYAFDHEVQDAGCPRDLLCLCARDRYGEGQRERGWQDVLERPRQPADTDRKGTVDGFGVEVASLGVQIHGGMGYIEKPVQPSTCAMPASHRFTRAPTEFNPSIWCCASCLLPAASTSRGLSPELKAVADEVTASNRPEFGATAARLGASIQDLEEATGYMLTALADGRMSDALSGATPYLRVAVCPLAEPCWHGARFAHPRNPQSGRQRGLCWRAVSARPYWRDRRIEIGHRPVRGRDRGLQPRSAGILRPETDE